MHDQPEPHNHTDPTPDILNPRRAMLAGLGGLAAGAFLAGKANAGPLTPPPGPISSTPGPEPRIPINQTNTPGDNFNTFRITQPGSYYFPGNLSGQPQKSGILIASSDVTIDMMGFRLQPVNVGSGSGIINSGNRVNITIRNGVIRKWEGSGIDLSAGGVSSVCSNIRIEGVTVTENLTRGIRAGQNAIVQNCIAQANGGDGIDSSDNTVVQGCIALSNTGTGIWLAQNGVVSGCNVRENGAIGIRTGFASVVTDCTARDNSNDGITVSNSSIVHACASRANSGTGGGIVAPLACTITRCSSSNNSGHGILVSGGCLIAGNTCAYNSATGFSGIRASGDNNRIEDNNCTNNNIGVSVLAGGNFIVRNTCRGNGTNWSIVANNKCLVINGTNAPAINDDSGGTSPGSTNPNANYTY